MIDNERKNNLVEQRYDELVLELKKELPNIVLPSMGMLDDVGRVEIDGKDYIISDGNKEE